MKIAFGTILLAGGNEVNERPYEITIHHARQAQYAPAVRATSAKYYDRGNLQTTFSFSVCKKHASSEAAQAYVLLHASSLTGLSSTLTVTTEPHETVYLLSSAVISSIVSHAIHFVSYHTYTIIGGIFKTA